MSYPTPEQTWLFLEEHPDSMNDPAFFSPHQDSWIDWPATYHNGATSISFADGHVELHPWEATLSLRRFTEVHGSYADLPWSLQPGDADVHWISYHSQRQTTDSY